MAEERGQDQIAFQLGAVDGNEGHFMFGVHSTVNEFDDFFLAGSGFAFDEDDSVGVFDGQVNSGLEVRGEDDTVGVFL